MMRTVSLPAFIRGVEERKQSLGVTGEKLEGARNSGQRRTPQKREQLARVQQRARHSGLEPIAANF
jgi:hypothetical protein